MNGAEKPGLAAAHLLVVIKVEVLAQLCGAVTWPACCQRIPENLFMAAQPLKRGGRGSCPCAMSPARKSMKLSSEQPPPVR